jgi:hypothetical protein
MRCCYDWPAIHCPKLQWPRCNMHWRVGLSLCFSLKRARFLTNARQFSEPERRFTLSADDIARINPNTKTAPVFRSRADAEMTAKLYARVPVFVVDNKGEAGNPWCFRYMTKMFDMADSSSVFRTASQLAEAGFERAGTDWYDIKGRNLRYVPLYEAKMISFFDHRAASYAERGDLRGYRVLPETTQEEHSNVTYEVEPFYWVAASDFEARMQDRPWSRPWLMGWKGVAAVTNERTVTAMAFPRVAVGHSIRVMFADGGQVSPAILLANLSALPP